MQLFLRKLTVSISCLLCSVLLSSCLITTDAKLQETKGKYEKEIAAAKESFEQKLEQTQNEINAAKNSVISAQDGQMQAAANSFYGQSLVFKSIIAPTRTDLINKNLMEEGWKALGNRVPDYKTMMEMNERIARELDETKTSLADLQKSHEKVMKENGKLTDATQAALDKVAAKELEMKSLRESYLKEIAALQSKLNEANNAIIAQKTKDADNAKARQAAFTKISSICGIVALACFAGAIFSPVFKWQIGVFGAICAFIAVAIWYVTPFMVGAVAASIGLIVVIAMAYRHWKEEKLSDSLVLGMQNAKEADPEKWKTEIAPHLDEQMQKYIVKNGAVMTKEDKSLKLLIDKKLAEYERK